MPSIVTVILIAVVAGGVGTGIGGILGVLAKKPKKLYIACMMAFAAGAMIAVSLFDLLPEAYEGGGLPAVLTGVVLGCGVAFLFEFVSARLSKKRAQKQTDSAVPCESLTDKRKLFATGVAIFVAMMLHSIPEGIAIGAGYHIELGLLLGAIMLIHFIPEGMAIAVPMKAGGASNIKIIALCFAAAIPTLLGAVIGYFLGMNETLIAYTLSFAAGVMLYVVFSQMLPISYKYTQKHGIVTLVIFAGIIVAVTFGIILH
jgi:ZIP family zinc transporter